MKNLNTPKFWDIQFKQEWDGVFGEKPSVDAFYRWDAHRFDVLSLLVEHTGKLLDIGCGLGSFVRFIKAKFPKLDITGIDFSKFAIEKAKELDDRITYHVGNTYRMDMFKDNTFNYVIASEILEHLSYPEKMLKEIKRVLKPGGMVVVSTPNPKEDGTLYSVEHIKEYAPQETEYMLRKYFEDIRYIMPPLMKDRKTGDLIQQWWYVAVGIKGGTNGK